MVFLDSEFFKILPKIELHAHLNGSISQETIVKLVKLHREKWPEEKMPENCDLVIQGGGGEYGTNKDPFLIFPIIHAITDNLEAVRIVTREVIKDFADDGVKYLELRTTPREVPSRMSKEDYCQTVLDEIIKASDSNRIVVKLLLSIDRKYLSRMDDIVELYKILKKNPRFEKILVGIDISGDPRVDDLRHVLEKINRIRFVDGIKVAVHLAEIPNHNETEAVLNTKPDRIGHGTCIHPSLGGSDTLWKLLLEHKSAVEVCLSSNVVCHTVPSFQQHQAGIYHKHGVPIIICTDDKGVFNCSLSQEFETAANAFHWSREDLFNISLNALNYAFIEEEEKTELKKSWMSWKEKNVKHFL